jgi:hypothetical protein
VRLDFLTKVKRFDVAELLEKPSLVDHLCRSYFLEHRGMEPLRPERARHGSKACVAFFGWTVAVIADILPAWTAEEVGGVEARKVIEAFEMQRRAQAKKLKEQKEAESKKKLEAEEEARRKAEASRCCEIATQTTPRDLLQEQQREEESRRQAELARLELEALQELERQKMQAEAELARAEVHNHSEDESQEDDSEDDTDDKDHCLWDISGNPDRRFLEGEDYIVSFPSDSKTNFVNVLTKIPFRRGAHYFECVMHHIGDEQWCGITDESFQAGSLVPGRRLSGWSYYCGRRQSNKPADRAALHVNREVIQEFDHVSSGDTVGIVVDASSRTAAFLKNGKLQGVCLLPRKTGSISKKHLYIFTHVDASGDCVELRQLPLTEVAQSVLDAMSSMTGKKIKISRQSGTGYCIQGKPNPDVLDLETIDDIQF